MKKLLTSLVLFATSFFAFSQIVTAADYFKSVSDVYAGILDYEAQVQIKIGKSNMRGRVSFKRPEMLRIDFTQPADQVVVFNGDSLVIYLPGDAAILEQNVTGSGVKAASGQGLSLLRRYYNISYETGQEPVPLEDTGEMVVNFILNRRSATEAFRTIKMSVNPSTKLIRRVVAITPKNETFVFDFEGYNLNTRMSEQRFIYDPPTSANNYNNFLLSE